MLTWDENKRKANLQVHGIDFAELEEVFDHFMDTENDVSHEHRLKHMEGGRPVVMIWIEQEQFARIIS
jgi:uncharacterized DUF497 family protein